MSVIRLSIEINTRPLDGLEVFLKNAERANQQILEDVSQRGEDQYLDDLRAFDPGPSRHGGGAGRWSTNPTANRLAQKWWWANVNDGTVNATPNGAYIRSNTLMLAWHFVLRSNRLALENTSDAARYVFSMAENIQARGGRPNPGHIDTGWPEQVRNKARDVLALVIDDARLTWSQSLAATVATGQYQIVAGTQKAVFK